MVEYSGQSGNSPTSIMPAANKTGKLAGQWILFTCSLIALFTVIWWASAHRPPLPLAIGWVIMAIILGWAATFGRRRMQDHR